MKKIKKMLSVALSGIMLVCTGTISFYAEEIKDTVYIGGETFGVKFYTNGVILVELEKYYDGQKYVCPAKTGGLQESDIIKEVNGCGIKTNEDLKTVVENSNGNTLHIKIERNGKELSKDIEPVKNTIGIYLIGAWVRDSCAGIGTVTYYDESNKYFAALGHGICDNDTRTLLPLAQGEVVSAKVSGVNKSVVGKAGSLNGYFSESSIGSLTKNSELGIFGAINDNFDYKDKKYEIADINEVKTGNAQLYTTVDDGDAQYYDIKIKRICNKNENSNENFIIEVTDENLIEKSGGIVQGMSGSPIVQNGKIVGAVTHVFVNSPTEGYGVYVQNMVDCYKK